MIKRVAIVHTELSWNRKPVFNLIGKEKSIELTVYSMRERNINAKNEKLSFKHIIFLQKNNLDFILNSFKLFLNITKNKYDIIIWGETIFRFELFLLLFFKRIYKIKLALWLDEWGWKKRYLRKMLDPLAKFLIYKSDKIITHGKKHYIYFRKLGVNKDKISLIRNSSEIEINSYTIEESRILKEKIAKNNKVILYVGRLIKRKGVEYLIKAYHLLLKEKNNAELWIIGDGKVKPELKKLVDELNINEKVKFFGWIDFKKLPIFYLASDVFVLPAINDEKEGAEPWGLVVNEAMFAKKPVIVTNSVGCSEDLVINNFNGYIVKEKSAYEIKEALAKILSDEKLAYQMGKNSEIIIKNYNYNKMASDFINIIKKL